MTLRAFVNGELVAIYSGRSSDAKAENAFKKRCSVGGPVTIVKTSKKLNAKNILETYTVYIEEWLNGEKQ